MNRAKSSNCLYVGVFAPLSQSSYFGNRLRSSAGFACLRLQAHCRSSGLTFMRGEVILVPYMMDSDVVHLSRRSYMTESK